MKFIDTNYNTIDHSALQLLLDQIPLIKNTSKFGEVVIPDNDKGGVISFPCILPAPVVSNFAHIVDKLVPAFNWMEWEDGKTFLNNTDTKYADLNLDTLCKLLAVINRIDRFNEGYLIARFEDGTVLKILEAIKDNCQI